MNTRTAVVIALFCIVNCLGVKGADAPPKSERLVIYDEKADGGMQIARALETAKGQNKRVLVQFGANWCGWCHKLHRLFETDPQIALALRESYVVVMVDVNNGHNDATDKKYGHPISHGLPVIVILDATGKPQVTKDTGELEEGDHHSPQKVLAFLQQWAGKKD